MEILSYRRVVLGCDNEQTGKKEGPCRCRSKMLPCTNYILTPKRHTSGGFVLYCAKYCEFTDALPNCKVKMWVFRSQTMVH